jgi:hypothetical protein
MNKSETVHALMDAVQKADFRNVNTGLAWETVSILTIKKERTE